MDGDVACLARCTTRGLYRMSKDNESAKGFKDVRCSITVEFGRACRWPFSPRGGVRPKVIGQSVSHTSGQ